MTRIILFTGKGGVGKTSISAATGLICAKEGKKTLIISTDPAHSLRDAFNLEIGSEPKKIAENLYLQEISVTEAIKKYWEKLKLYLTSLMRSQGVEGIAAEEIATLPGFDEASQLLYIRQYAIENTYDVIVMDTAPTGESLKLLSFPEAFSWYMERLFPISRKTAKIMRPFMKPLLGVPIPDDTVFASIEELYSQMRDVEEILSDGTRTTIRLVCNPDTMSFNETKRAYTYLLMYGYSVDAMVINKIFQDDSGDFLLKWRKSQNQIIEEIEDAFGDIKIFRLPMSDEEPTGIKKLENMGKKVYGDIKPWEILSDIEPPIEFEVTDKKKYIKMKVPFANKQNLTLHNRGGELVVQIDNWRRVFFLPQSMADLNPSTAEFNKGKLIIEMI
ncbi:MAG: ArsA family ATPase [Candidatus Thermoplasmatota archaeon]|jgi:arsenite-transporting ATPase|nr:ArsA family ATPase [Candidatus Thermoplasmatota archaeon]MCL5790899.1 ArsA family ATPase [Candidatus Thermoplasmatota archaeon]